MFKRRSKARSIRTKDSTVDAAPVNAAGGTESATTTQPLPDATSQASDAGHKPQTHSDPSLDTLTLSENQVDTPEQAPLVAQPLDSQGPSPSSPTLSASASEMPRRKPRAKTRTKASSKSMLSFMGQSSNIGAEEDEDVEVFAIKKTKASRKFAQRKDRMTKSNLALSETLSTATSATQSPRPEYSQEALAHLKRSTFEGTSRASGVPPSSTSILDQINEQIQQGKTPDPNLIREARRYRELQRQQDEETTAASHESEFISLAAGAKASLPLGPMVVVDDEDIFDEDHLRNNGALDDEAAFDEDLILGDKAVLEHETQERLAKAQALADAETEVLDGDDDEVRRWEMDQIRNGSDGRAAGVFKHDKETITHKVTNAIKVVPVPNLSDFRRQMQERLANLQDIQATNEHELARVTNEMDKTRESLARIATKRQTLRERYAHYSELLQDPQQTLTATTKESVATNASIASPTTSPQASE